MEWDDRSRGLLTLVVALFVLLALVLFLCGRDAGAAQKADPPAVRHLNAAIVFLGKRYRDPVDGKRALKIARWLHRYGRMWKVDPWIGVSIACQESKFHDKPRRIRIKRCKTEIDGNRAIEVCKMFWPGERGMMQIIPAYARNSFTACKGRSWKDPDELYDTETNVCVGMHLLAERRAKVKRRKVFLMRGGRWKWTRRHGPCSRRQRRFCHNGTLALCARLWWVAAWNWGSHRVICRRVSRQYDFAGYPIKIIRRYRLITRLFRRQCGPRCPYMPTDFVWHDSCGPGCVPGRATIVEGQGCPHGGKRRTTAAHPFIRGHRECGICSNGGRSRRAAQTWACSDL